MDDKENEIKECFAYFGRAMYMAQTVEKGILNSLLFSYTNITKTRYDELLAEKSLLTFGQLKQEVIAKNIFDSDFIEKLEEFHSKRDWLAHNYWWDRSVEFNREDLRHKLFKELDEFNEEFEALYDLIEDRLTIIMKQNGLDPNELFDAITQLDQTPQTPLLRKLTKNETLIGLYSYESAVGSLIPIFKLEDNTYWSLCEIGLTTFTQIEDERKLTLLEKTKDIFPVLQFNPRPKIATSGEYELDLKKNGLFMKVEQVLVEKKVIFKWGIRKK